VAAGVADCAQMSGHDTALSEACAFWQSSQENSSLLRGAARVLTGMPHYFSASYIANYEQKACGDPASRSRAHVLLEAVRTSLSREPSDWADEPQPPGIGFASRGLKCKPEDEQILEVLRSGEIVMPLWGVTLSREVATGYGTRFTFVIEGAFQGVAAWRESGIKAEELEVIAGAATRSIRRVCLIGSDRAPKCRSGFARSGRSRRFTAPRTTRASSRRSAARAARARPRGRDLLVERRAPADQQLAKHSVALGGRPRAAPRRYAQSLGRCGKCQSRERPADVQRPAVRRRAEPKRVPLLDVAVQRDEVVSRERIAVGKALDCKPLGGDSHVGEQLRVGARPLAAVALGVLAEVGGVPQTVIIGLVVV
jgi:hypothetical protein